jgi:hypothetical protein
MENSKPYPLVNKVFLGALMLGLIILLQSCARKIAFQTSTIVPAAEGTVKLTKDNNSNYVIHMNLSNLAEPQRLQPARQAYVVWMESEQQRVKNIGQISTSAGILSKRLKASFETVSPVKPTRIFITAEDDATVQYPGLQVITTDNF